MIVLLGSLVGCCLRYSVWFEGGLRTSVLEAGIFV